MTINSKMSQMYYNDELQKIFRKHIIAFLRKWNKWDDPKAVMCWKRGATMSYVRDHLEQDKGWIQLGGSAEFESRLNDAGFELVPAKKKNGEDHKTASIVVVTT